MSALLECVIGCIRQFAESRPLHASFERLETPAQFAWSRVLGSMRMCAHDSDHGAPKRRVDQLRG